MEKWWGSIIAIVLMYSVMGVIFCCGGQRVYPYNMVWLFLFTLCFSYLISQVTSVYAYYYGGPLVLTAAGLTLLVVVALTLFALFSRNDFRFLWAAAVAIMASMIGFGILCIFSWSPVLYQLYSALVVALLGILLVVDTKLILGGNRGFEISMDNYILGALVIYIDIMRIFLVILRMLGARK